MAVGNRSRSAAGSVLLSAAFGLNALGLVALGLVGCAAGPPKACRVGSDCDSGVCRADGTCLPVDDAGVDAGPGVDASIDGAVPDGGGVDGGGGGVCRPNMDGIITRAESPFGPGRTATYASAPDTSVDTMGSDAGGGRRLWDYSMALPGDRELVVTTVDPSTQWYADDFPDADYAARLSGNSELIGVFQLTDTELLLLGVVSPEGAASETNLSYSPPVTVLELPLEEGNTFTTNTTITGLAEGIFVTYFESYESTVDARGQVVTPYGTFEEALRVHTELTRNVGGFFTVVQQHTFVTECFGPITTLVSEDNELDTEFTSAAEVRRLAP